MDQTPKRRWFRSRLRTALLVIALLCIPLAQYPYFKTRFRPSVTLRSYETSDGRVITRVMSREGEIDFRSPTPGLLYALAVDVAIVIGWWMLTPTRRTSGGAL